MISAASTLLLAAAIGAPQVEASTLEGSEHKGELVRIADGALVLKQDGKETSLPLAQLLSVEFAAGEDAQKRDPAALQMRLVDGTVVSFTTIKTDARTATVESPLGTVALPLASIASLRLAPADSKVESSWTELRGRQPKGDLIVIRKEDVLDHLDGVVESIDDQTVNFLYDGQQFPVKRERVFGIVYGRKPGSAKPQCEITLAGGDVLQAKSLKWDGEQLDAVLVAGPEVKLPPERVRTLDFSLGKVRYLSQMEPETATYTPFFDDGVDDFSYRRDRGIYGEPITLGGKQYARGLSIHSKMLLRYRLAGEYRRFQAVMGIDEANLPTPQLGHVHVVISGDGKPLFEADVSGSDKPAPLDLDVSGVRFLEILVDYGANLNIADHLDLADARVIK